ncbi:MAG: hypothetical protein FD148_2858 [Methylocystaceae bacterium]|nr:MAG: hypothetical protein FD148_2858 [Methylocystaceae bacterium]
MVEGDRAGPPGDQHGEDRHPIGVDGPPCIRIDEDLDDDRHRQKNDRRQARQKPKDKQQRQDEFEAARHIGGDGRRNERQFIFVDEQREGRAAHRCRDLERQIKAEKFAA